MSFLRASSPHTLKQGNTGSVMLTVILACIPGVAALTYFFGYGTLINILLTSVFCMGFEALALKIRKRNLGYYLRDYSALLTAVLLAISLPPYAPWWLLLVGSFFAIVVAKQLYGGLGFNPFNPAMVAYVVLLISFPLEMTRWVQALAFSEFAHDFATLSQGLSQVFLGAQLNLIDGYTAATPLDVVKQNTVFTLDELYKQETLFSSAAFAGHGWEWVSVAFLLGGVYLLHKRVFTWHAPVAMLLSLTLVTAIVGSIYTGSSQDKGSVLFHLFSGATMFGAFFIVTDPVTSATSNRGRLIYGAFIGLLIYVIRAWGNYPDAVAFAVLLMNFAAPTVDYFSKPRTYGHAPKKTKSKETV